MGDGVHLDHSPQSSDHMALKFELALSVSSSQLPSNHTRAWSLCKVEGMCSEQKQRFIAESSVRYSGLYYYCLSADLDILTDMEQDQFRVDRLWSALSTSIVAVAENTIGYTKPVRRFKDFLTP